MSNLISGKEALIAWFDGEEVEVRHKSTGWYAFNDHNFGINVFKSNDHEFRLKPRTITINGIEVPAPFEPKKGDRYWCLSTQTHIGYGHNTYESEHVDGRFINIGAWRTEEEIKQVVAALRQVFKGEQA